MPPTNAQLSEQELREFEEIGALKEATVKDRERHVKYFSDYIEERIVTEAENLKELFSTQGGRDLFSKHFSEFFLSLRVRGGDFPKKGYAENIRSSIKANVLRDTGSDIFNPEKFPQMVENWKKYSRKLAQEGKSVTEHKEEVPPETMNKIFTLLTNTKAALENRDGYLPSNAADGYLPSNAAACYLPSHAADGYLPSHATACYLLSHAADGYLPSKPSAARCLCHHVMDKLK